MYKKIHKIRKKTRQKIIFLYNEKYSTAGKMALSEVLQLPLK